jgi:hypothetical protein
MWQLSAQPSPNFPNLHIARETAGDIADKVLAAYCHVSKSSEVAAAKSGMLSVEASC